MPGSGVKRGTMMNFSFLQGDQSWDEKIARMARAIRGPKTRVSAMITFRIEGPSTPISTMAKMIEGKAIMASMIRINSESSRLK